MHITKHRTMALVTIAQFVQSDSEIRSGKCVFDWVNPAGFITGSSNGVGMRSQDQIIYGTLTVITSSYSGASLYMALLTDTVGR